MDSWEGMGEKNQEAISCEVLQQDIDKEREKGQRVLCGQLGGNGRKNQEAVECLGKSCNRSMKELVTCGEGICFHVTDTASEALQL